jgi:hypothetical protein
MTNGSCVCKKVTYTFSAEPIGRVRIDPPPSLASCKYANREWKRTQSVCHCKQCHKLSGSAFTYNYQLKKEDLKILTGEGELKEGSFVQEAGIEMRYYFCPNCGTNIYKKALAEPFLPFVLLQAGTIDGDEMVTDKPAAEIWTSRRAKWMGDGFPGIEQRPQF